MPVTINGVYISDEDIGEIDGGIVASVIEHHASKGFKSIKPHNIMKFDDKLQFNHLSQNRADDLEMMNFHTKDLNDFLQKYKPKSKNDSVDVHRCDVLLFAVVFTHIAAFTKAAVVVDIAWSHWPSAV